jgi:hypothetical protein
VHLLLYLARLVVGTRREILRGGWRRRRSVISDNAPRPATDCAWMRSAIALVAKSHIPMNRRLAGLVTRWVAGNLMLRACSTHE